MRRLTLGRDHVREIGGTLSNEIRFASTHALSTTFFPGWLRGLHDEHEAGTITLIADHMVACERFMLEGKADFQIGRAHVELQSLMRISYAVFCLKKNKLNNLKPHTQHPNLHILHFFASYII